MAKIPSKSGSTISKEPKNYTALLAELFSAVKSSKEMEELVADMFTSAERKDLWERWSIVDMLLRGNSQREIRDFLKVSISKVTRGSHALQFGTGAFRRLWENRNKR